MGWKRATITEFSKCLDINTLALVLSYNWKVKKTKKGLSFWTTKDLQAEEERYQFYDQCRERRERERLESEETVRIIALQMQEFREEEERRQEARRREEHERFIARPRGSITPGLSGREGAYWRLGVQ